MFELKRRLARQPKLREVEPVSLRSCELRETTSTAAQRRLVGPERVERSTSRLSGVRSNHLSYEPDEVSDARDLTRTGAAKATRIGRAAFDGKEGKRGRRQDSPLLS